MPIPKSKNELLEMSQQNYDRLFAFIDALPKSALKTEFPSSYLNRNIRDVLGHLHHWHLLFIDWYEVGMAGEKPAIPAKGYTWKTTPELNKMIQQKYSNMSMKKVSGLLESSHAAIMELIKKHSDTELFEKKKYKWTGSTSMGVYLRGATTSHYDWAYKMIKKCLK